MDLGPLGEVGGVGEVEWKVVRSRFPCLNLELWQAAQFAETKARTSLETGGLEIGGAGVCASSAGAARRNIRRCVIDAIRMSTGGARGLSLRYNYPPGRVQSGHK